MICWQSCSQQQLARWMISQQKQSKRRTSQQLQSQPQQSQPQQSQLVIRARRQSKAAKQRGRQSWKI
jgi:hypothetical protein